MKSSCHEKKESGFTLIEILVVLFIISITIGVVSPNIISIYHKTEIRLEQDRALRVLNVCAIRAFLQNTEYTVTLHGSSLLVKTKDSIRKTFKFENITFNDTTIIFNRSGFADKPYDKIKTVIFKKTP